MSIVPEIDWSPLANLGNIYTKAKNEATLGQLGQGLADGTLDYQKAAGMAAQSGRLDLTMSLLDMARKHKASEQFNSLVPQLAGGGAQPGAPAQPPITGAPQATAPDMSQPRGLRNNNPLNIEAGQFTAGQPGYTGSDGRFAKFESQDQGVQAASKLIDTYGTKYGLNTVAGIIGRWAPAGENDTRGYAASVAGRLGVDPNQPLNLSDPKVKTALIGAMAQFENGRPMPQGAPSQAMGYNGVPERPDARGVYSADATLTPDQPPQPAPFQVAQAGGGPVPVPAASSQPQGAPPATPQATQPGGGPPMPATSQVTRSIPMLLKLVANEGLDKGQRDAAKVLLEHALKTSDLPEAQKNYVLYRTQGGNLPFFEYEKQLKTAGATMINTAEGMDAAQTKARIAIDTHAIQDLSKKVASGRASIPLLERMISIADKTPGGWAGQVSPTIAKALSSFGIPVPEGISNAELMISMSRQFIPAVRDPGATSNLEQSLFSQAVPGLAQSPEGRIKIASMMRSQIDRNAEIMQIYRENVGSPDLDKKLSALDAKPMFSPGDRQYLEKVTKTAQGESGTAQAAPQGQPLPPPEVGHVINGKRYNGGPPNDRNSWAPVI